MARLGERHEVHDLDWRVGFHEQLPFARAIAQPVIVPDGLQLGGIESRRRHCGNGDLYLAARRRAGVIDSGDGDGGGRVAGIDQPQPAHLVEVASGIEDGNAVSTVFALGDKIVHRRQEAVGGRADIRKRLDVEIARQPQPPIAFPRPRAHGQTLRRVAVLQVIGVEMDRLVGVDVQGHRAEHHSLVVDGLDLDRARLCGVVDDARETLERGIRGCGEHQHVVILGIWTVISDAAVRIEGIGVVHVRNAVVVVVRVAFVSLPVEIGIGLTGVRNRQAVVVVVQDPVAVAVRADRDSRRSLGRSAEGVRGREGHAGRAERKGVPGVVGDVELVAVLVGGGGAGKEVRDDLNIARHSAAVRRDHGYVVRHGEIRADLRQHHDRLGRLVARIVGGGEHHLDLGVDVQASGQVVV